MNQVGISFLLNKPWPLWSVWKCTHTHWILLPTSYSTCKVLKPHGCKPVRPLAALRCGHLQRQEGPHPEPRSDFAAVGTTHALGGCGKVCYFHIWSLQAGRAGLSSKFGKAERARRWDLKAGVSMRVPSPLVGACEVWNSCWHERSPDVGQKQQKWKQLPHYCS